MLILLFTVTMFALDTACKFKHTTVNC